MAARSIVLVLCFLATCSLRAQSWHDNSRYIALTPRTGYYFLRPSSALQHQLGFDAAPDKRHRRSVSPRLWRGCSRSPLRSPRRSRCPPAYIVQGLPNNFYTARLSSLIPGRTTSREVNALFGRHATIEKRGNGYNAYYEIPVYNSFEDWSGRGRR